MLGFVLLLGLGCGTPSCGLLMMPVRVVGSVAEHSYKAGEKVVDASSKALDERKAKKQAAQKAQDQNKPQNPEPPDDLPLPPAATRPAPASAPPPPPPPLGAEPETLPPLPGNAPAAGR